MADDALLIIWNKLSLTTDVHDRQGHQTRETRPSKKRDEKELAEFRLGLQLEVLGKDAGGFFLKLSARSDQGRKRVKILPEKMSDNYFEAGANRQWSFI